MTTSHENRQYMKLTLLSFIPFFFTVKFGPGTACYKTEATSRFNYDIYKLVLNAIHFIGLQR